MSNQEAKDKFQLGQLIRFKAHSLDVTTRIKNPDRETKEKDYQDLAVYLKEWLEHGHEITADIAWAQRRLNLYETWKKRPSMMIKEAEQPSANDDSKLEEIIKGRRSIRFWKKKAVSSEDVHSVLEAGLYAPSAFNRLPWRFFVAETPLDELKDGDASNPGMFASAPVRIFVAADERLFFEKYSGALDSGLAMQNMLLTAHARGLGTCLIYQGEFVDPALLEKYYQIPTYCTVYCAVLLGYPDETPELPARMPVEEVTTFLGEVSNPDF